MVSVTSANLQLLLLFTSRAHQLSGGGPWHRTCCLSACGFVKQVLSETDSHDKRRIPMVFIAEVANNIKDTNKIRAFAVWPC